MPSDTGIDASVEDAVADVVAADTSVRDAMRADSFARDASAADLSPGDAVVADAAVGDATVGDSGAVSNSFGFSMREPQEHTIACDWSDPRPLGHEDEIVVADADWICSFDYGGESGHVYVKATPVECVSFGLSQGARYEGRGSSISLEGSVTPTADASYDWGGNHHNDSMGFSHRGKYFRYFHSSFGWGFRKCHEMDCIKVFDGKGGELLEDGCSSERTLPVVCHPVEAGLSYGAGDFVDTFSKCPGDMS